MDGDKTKESALDCASGAPEPTKKQEKRKRACAGLDVVGKESGSAAEWQREIDALYEYYKEVSGHQLNPEELSCTTSDSIIACLLEESSLSCAKLTDGIYRRMNLQDGITESSVRTSVLNIGRRSSYGISAMDVDGLEDESDSSLWCWETQDLALLPLHLHSSLSIRRTARKLIHKRILLLSGTSPSLLALEVSPLLFSSSAAGETFAAGSCPLEFAIGNRQMPRSLCRGLQMGKNQDDDG